MPATPTTQYTEPVIGAVGFYRQDPSHNGKNPLVVIDRHGDQILTEEAGGLQFWLDLDAWMGVEEFKDELIAMATQPKSAGPIDKDMHGMKIRGRITALADAVTMALHVDNILERYSQVCLASPAQAPAKPQRMRAA